MPKIINDEEIFRAVIQTVSEYGYSGATTKQMASDAEISEVTLFRKYGSKEQLVKASISFIIGQADLKSASKYTGNVQADLIRLVKTFHDIANEYGEFFSIMIFELQRHLDLLELVGEPLDMFMTIMGLITRYQEEGTLVKEHPMIAWVSLVSPILIAFNMNKVIPNLEFQIGDIKDHVTNFLSGRLEKTNES